MDSVTYDPRSVLDLIQGMTDKLTHLDAQGAARMVDVGAKPLSRRIAVASGAVEMLGTTARLITGGAVPKGDVIAVARVAGIMAAKRCGEIVPLCHPLPLESVDVAFEWPASIEGERVRLLIRATCAITAKTGVEMEALAAVMAAALSVYDMCKAVDKTMSIEAVRVESKTKRAVM